MAAPLIVSNEEARALILARTGLSGERPPVRAGALRALIGRLGYVQLDSLRVVERAHHHILFARHAAYRPRHLSRLLGKPPALFEHWTHDSSLIPIEHYPHWRHRFAWEKSRVELWRERLCDTRAVANVRAHVEKHGAARARDFAHLGGRTGPWWGWAPAKAALEYLWRTGEFAVIERDGFEKIYDLAERLIPESLRAERPSRTETREWACREALARLGAATPKMLADFWDHCSIEEAARWIEGEKRRGRLIDVTLKAANGRRDFAAVARPELEAERARLPAPASRLKVLSPFDPLLRDRDRIARLFAFDYRIEVYVPAPRRTYGYYVFPLLEGDRLAGRIDMKAERDRDRLAVKGLWLEPRLTLSKARRAKLEAELARQARLASVRDIVFPAAALKTG